MSESTFTIRFKCNAENKQVAIFDAFNYVALNPEKDAECHKHDDPETINCFKNKICELLSEEPSENLIELLTNEEFFPESLTEKDRNGFSVLYIIGSSSAGFGGWPSYTQLLTMEELFNLLGVDEIKFPLLKEAKSMGDILSIFDE